MTDIQWLQLWQQSQSDSVQHAALTLLLLNGLSATQIEHFLASSVDLEDGWITTYDGQTLPLVRYARDALAVVSADGACRPERWAEAARDLAPLQAEAQRRLSGAVWITDDALRLTLETTGSPETPIVPLPVTFPFSVAERLQPGEASEVAQQARDVLQAAADWLVTQTLTPRVSLVQRSLGLLRQGSLVFLVASTGVSGLNLIHNVLMGRLLSPADYSQLTFIITLQLLIGLLPAAMQTVVARFSARYSAQSEEHTLAALHRLMGRFGWVVGGVVALIVLMVSPLLIEAFRLDGMGVLLPLILVLPFFVRMGVDRGFLQGLGSYFWLTGAYVSEGVVRLGVSVALGYALLSVGQALEGAVWGVTQSMLVTWFVSFLALRHFVRRRQQPERMTETSSDDRRAWLQLGGMTALMLIGQALITNSDFLLVKNFFSSEDAGLYAAISVLGRIVYFGALPLTVLLVPLVARRQALGQVTRPILMLLIGGGLAVCGLLIAVAAIFGPDVLRLLYGEAYVPAAGLLAPYALAASLYTLTNLVITYQIALGNGGETGLPILAGCAQIIGVLAFHESLAQVITVQIVLMSLLFAGVFWRVLRPRRAQPTPQALPAPATG